MNKIRVFEAFSGIGTQRMALRNVGLEHEVVGISEIDKHAISSYMAIHGVTKNFGDISKINIEDIPDHDLFTYSFPCQDISVAGKQGGLEKGSGTRSSLLWECNRVIENKKPKYLLMENVKNLVGKKHRENFDKWLQHLESLGYNNYWKVLNSKNYGVPQNRERVFCVSVLGGEFNFTEGINSGITLKSILESEVDDKYFIDDKKMDELLVSHNGESVSIRNATKKGFLDAYLYDGVDLGYPNSKTRRGRVQKEQSHTLTCDNSKGVVVARMVGRNKENPKSRVSGLPTTQMIEPRMDGRSGCLTTVQKDNMLVEYSPLKIRRFTPKECWRLMGVNDEDFYKANSVVSDSQLYKQAGNAIVVNVLESIFKDMFF